MTFRNDLNGLRAIAVIAVVIYHFNPSWLSGGFAGVDVFFVISGFLMTGIIFDGLKKNNFNITHFYLARAERIVPALAVLCIAIIFFSLFFVHVIDQLSIHKHVVGSLFFYSNIQYMNESGYFDVESHSKWLLHTWSLAVEWQFYILFPLVLLSLSKLFPIRHIKWMMLIATAMSFLISVLMTEKWSVMAYYLLPSRGWEMLVGGIAFLYPICLTSLNSKIAEIIGMSMIVLAFIWVDSTLLWPGVYALLPVIGTYLVIIANQQSSKLTHNKLFSSLGKWSYSIYLWHWPIYVAGLYFAFDNWWVLGIPLSVLMGYLSFEFVESKRSNKIFTVRYMRSKALNLLLIALLLSNAAYEYADISRLPEELKLTEQEYRNSYEGHANLKPKENGLLFINSTLDEFEYIVIGDSMANHLNFFFSETGLKVVSLALDGCYSSKNYYNKSTQNCVSRYEKQIEFIRQNPGKKIIVSRSWNVMSPDQIFSRQNRKKISFTNEMRVDELNLFVNEVKQFSSQIYVIAGNQATTFIAYRYLASEFAKGRKVITYNAPIRTSSILPLIKSNSSGNYKVIDLSTLFCDINVCPVIKNGWPLYTDRVHMSKQGNLHIKKKLAEALN